MNNNVLRKDYKVSKDVFKSAKILGFKGMLKPSQSMVQKWLREKYNIEIEIYCGYDFHIKSYTFLVLRFDNNGLIWKEGSPKTFDKYEDALENALCISIKLIKSIC